MGKFVITRFKRGVERGGVDEDQLKPDAALDETEDDYALKGEVVSAILDAVHNHDQALLTQLMEPLHAADIADLLEQIGHDERVALVRLYGREFDGEILSEIDEAIRDDIVAALSPEVLSEAVRELDSDDVVDLIEDLDEPQQEQILDALADADRVAVEQALAWPEFSAGRLMQREMAIGPEHWTVGDAIDYLRSAPDLPDQFYHLILVDPRMHPVAYCTLGRILSSSRDTRLTDITEDSFRTFDASEAEGDVAYAFNQYHLISAPVVDSDGRLAGVITIDDAIRILDEEHEEDILRLAGVGESSLSDTAFETLRRRIPWLGVNLLTAIVSALVISQFSDTISQIVALAVLMPIVASMGGNAGTQALTVAVRALATRDLTSANAWRVVRREVAVGLMNGITFALIIGTVSWLWFSWPELGLVIGLAMTINLVVAGLSGVVVPLLLDRFELDPALASGTFVTTMTDVVGFFTFLGLATLVLL
jgi:magnesium transporter